LAEEKHCVVVYPAQSQAANPSRCWNWFKAVDQQRERGEPALIAGITREVIGHYQLDQSRVYVAGLSSGGAMAVIMATTYPDLYAAVGVHSGLPYGAANDLPSALAAMRGSLPGHRRQLPARHAVQSESTPIIIFHGDNDSTVNASNGEQMMQQNADQSLPGGLHDTSRIPPHVIVQQGQVPNGYRYTCTSRHQGDEKILAEHWIVHGGGHAWFGGSTSGSYTDPNGPDASREMLRFFYGQSPPAPG
jgi:poly(hydroxyalkanoate) depolymerase family esterase